MSNLAFYKQMHAKGKFPGHSTEKWSDQIAEIIKEFNIKTILDFGSGKGMQYTELKLHEKWGVEMPTLYDPAVPGLDKIPNIMLPFDMVICCDVLERGDEEASECELRREGTPVKDIEHLPGLWVHTPFAREYATRAQLLVIERTDMERNAALTLGRERADIERIHLARVEAYPVRKRVNVHPRLRRTQPGRVHPPGSAHP